MSCLCLNCAFFVPSWILPCALAGKLCLTLKSKFVHITWCYARVHQYHVQELVFYLLSGHLRNTCLFSLQSVSYSVRGNYVLSLPSTKSKQTYSLLILLLSQAWLRKKFKQFRLPDDFCKLDVTILSQMSHSMSRFPAVFNNTDRPLFGDPQNV